MQKLGLILGVNCEAAWALEWWGLVGWALLVPVGDPVCLREGVNSFNPGSPVGLGCLPDYCL